MHGLPRRLLLLSSIWRRYDEGTALLPIVSSKRSVPRGSQFIALDVDGYDLPPDW